jgi:hypothetical protein
LPGRSLRGPYLVFSEAADPESYERLFRRFLACGFLLPPDPSLPAIIPAELSEGEEKALSAAIAGH